jgi:hypothetical protein
MRSNLRKHLLKRGVYVGKHGARATISDLLYEVTKQEEQHQWTDEDIEATIKELAEPMHTRALRNRLNQTFDGLATGLKLTQPTATATIPPDGLAAGLKSAQLTATTTVPPGTQIHTPMTPQTPTTLTPQQVATAATEQNNPQQPAQQQYIPQRYGQQQHYPQTPVAFVPQQPAQQHTLLQSTLQQTPDPGGGTASYKKEAATVAKMYTDSQKYDGVSESFDFKLTIFEDICRRAGLQPDGYMIAFPTC